MRIPAHPGRILKAEMAARGLSANRLALDLGVPATRIGAILAGRRSVTADTALRLARYFATSPRFWMNLQTNHDLGTAKAAHGAEIDRRVAAAKMRAARAAA